MTRESESYSRETDHRIAEIEKRLNEQSILLKPILSTWEVSKVLGKILLILGGMAVGAATIISAIGSFPWSTK